MPFFLIFTFTLKMEDTILHYLTNDIILFSTLKGCHFTAPMSLVKLYMQALEQSFSEFLEQPVKLKIFLVIVNS